MGERKLVPKRRFRRFELGWEEKSFESLAEIVRGASPRPIEDPKWFDNNSNIGWLRISDVTSQNGRITNLEQKISVLGQQKTRVVKNSHLLLSIAATVGKPVINYVETGVHDGFLIFLKPKFDIEYMYQWLEMFRSKWQQYGQPGSQVNLNSDIVKKHIFLIPDIEEQQKIGVFFKVLDERIANQERKIAKVKALKAAYLTEMFPQEGETVPKRRFNGFEGEWEEKRLGELSIINTGESDVKDSVLGGEYPFFVRSKNIESSDVYTYDGEAILIPGEGKLGEIYHYYNGKFNYHQRVYKISDFDENVDGKFIYYIMHTTFKQHALKHTVKATVDSLRLPTLTSYKFRLPNKKEQQKIGEFFKNLDDQIETEEKKLDKLQKMKEAYLEEMFV